MAIPTSRRLAGIAAITVDGVSYDIVGDLVWSASSIKRESLSGQTRVEGYSEMPTPGFIEATLRDNSAFAVALFNSLTDSTVAVLQANGKSILGTGMWTTDPQQVRTQEGSFSVRFESDDVSEVNVSG